MCLYSTLAHSMQFPFLAPPHCLLVDDLWVLSPSPATCHFRGPAVPGLHRAPARLPGCPLCSGMCVPTPADVGRGALPPALSLRRPLTARQGPCPEPLEAHATWPSLLPSTRSPCCPACEGPGHRVGRLKYTVAWGHLSPPQAAGTPGWSVRVAEPESGGWDLWGARLPLWVQETRLCLWLLFSW